MDVRNLIQKALSMTASDLHLIVGIPPMLRIAGDIKVMEGVEKLTPETAKTLVYSLLSDEQKKNFERDLRISISSMIGPSQLRVSCYYHLGYVEATNLKAKNIIRRAYGYRDKTYMKLKIIQGCTPWMSQFRPWTVTYSSLP